MIDLKTFQALTDNAKRLQGDADRAEGALAEIDKRLAKDFSCASLDDAEKLQTKLTKELAETEKKYNAELTTLKREHPQLFT